MNYETKIVIISWLPWVARALLAGSSPQPPDDDGDGDDGAVDDGDDGAEDDGDIKLILSMITVMVDDSIWLTFSAVFP